MELLGGHLDRNLDGRLLLLLLLLLRLLLHDGHHRVCWFLNLSFDYDDTSLGVYRTQSVLVCCTVSLVEEMREHVAVVTDEECVRHVGQLLRVLASEMERRGHLISDDVIHIVGTG